MDNSTRHLEKRRSFPSPRLFLAGCLALVLWLVISPSALAETLRFKLRGQEAVAGFSSTDETGCVVTHMFLAALDADVKVGPEGKGA